ncbi:callose synthase 7 [Quercus suber]|uniref:Callose synthase 7 n=1 Tax=Quercus suber TaxID=58331 RepID=A0AAW0L3U4_QUESU
MYSRSHYVKVMEIIIILIYYKLAAQDFNIVVSSSIFILEAPWLYIPFIFNPLGFSWNKIWCEEQEHLRSINMVRCVTRIILALCFLAIQYSFVETVA